MPFQALGLAEPITRALVEARYTAATPIQAAAIPVVLTGRDLIGIAQTGTGKTAAFALPILHQLAAAPKRVAPKSCRVLVLSPTRELSGQITDSFSTYGRNLRISVRLAIGGVPIGKQIRGLANGVDVLVATPGRLLDLCKSRALNLGAVEFLVLDEADRMLDMGFIRDIRRIVAMLPEKRQTLFFSATMPPEIAQLAGDMLSNPAKVSVAPPASTVERVEQRVVHVGRADKPGLLAQMLKDEPIERALVFTRTKHGADRVVRTLAKAGISAEAIHGNKSQGQREKALLAFRNGKVRNLIATDIAARGIDVVGISHVINYDLPNIPETYVHRIGRTARAGKAGVAISLCSVDEAPFLRSIEKLIRSQIPSDGSGPMEAKKPAKAAPSEPPRGPRGRGRRHGNNGRPGNNRPPHRGEEIGAIAFLREPRRGASEPTG
jgi:ATP-dependent RNA helicase RhlE